MLAQRAIPENTLACVVDNLTHPSPAPPPTGGECPGGGGGHGGSGAGGPGSCTDGRWQMQETLVTTDCQDPPASLPFVLSIAGAEVGLEYDGGHLPCTGVVTGCAIAVDCNYGASTTAHYDVAFDGEAASGTELWVEPSLSCESEYTLTGTRMP